MNSRKVSYSCFLICLSVLLVSSWSAPAVAGDAADLRLAAGPISGGAGNPTLPVPIQPSGTKPLVGGVEANPIQGPATSVTPKTAGSALVPAKARVIKVEGLTRQQFDQLQIQNSDAIEYKGKQYNFGTLLSQNQKAEATALAAMKQKEIGAQGRFEAYRADFAKVQLNNLAVANTKVAAQAKQFMQRVQASGKALPPFNPIPVIEGTTVEVTPGGKVLIAGSGFGNPTGMNPPGEVYLSIGDFSKRRIYRGPSSTAGSFPMAIEWWSDTRILGTIPADIAGCQDQQGTLVVKVGGRSSNLWPVTFIATREVLTTRRMQVTSCSITAAYNECLWIFTGYHVGDWLQWAAKGNDVFKASLLNGYKFTNMDILAEGSGTATVKNFTPSSSSMDVVVDWNFDVLWVGPIPVYGRMNYTIIHYVVGPINVIY